MRTVPYPHPGEILQEEFLKPMGISQYRLAKEIHVPQRRIGEIVAGMGRGVGAVFAEDGFDVGGVGFYVGSEDGDVVRALIDDFHRLPHRLRQRGGKRGSGAQQHGSGDMGG